MATNWSHYQQAIFSAIRDTSDSLLVEAVAGSGKTSTLVEAVKYVPANQSVCFLAFNKRIAEELKKRVTAPNATCLTLHAAGWAAWRGHLAWDAGDCKVAEPASAKTRAILDDEAVFSRRERWGVGEQTARLVGYAKQHGVVPGYCAQDPANSEYFGLVDDVEDTWDELIEHYGLIREECNVDAARKILRESLRRSRAVVDYDDMLWLPVVGGVGFQRYDVVFVDEAQDVSGIQMEMIRRMVCPVNDYAEDAGLDFMTDSDEDAHIPPSRPNGRVIAVGDRFQAIYGFRGAMSNSMQLLAERFGCRPLPLSISYRCPKSVVLHAQQWVKHLEYADATCTCSHVRGQHSPTGKCLDVIPVHRWDGVQLGSVVGTTGCPCINYEEAIPGAVDGVVLGPMESAKDWEGQAAIALGAPLPLEEIGVSLAPDSTKEQWLENTLIEASVLLETAPAYGTPSREDRALGLSKTEPCLCTHSFAYHLDHMVHDNFYLGRCQAEHCGCLSYVPQGGNDGVTREANSEGILQEVRSPSERGRGSESDPQVSRVLSQSEAVDGGTQDYGTGALRTCQRAGDMGGAGAMEGITKWLPYYESFAPGDAILCRVNRPLAALAFRLIRARVPCKLLGRDIGAGLVALVKRLANKPDMEGSIENLQERLEEYRQREGKRLLAKRDDAGLATLYDKLDTVMVFLEEAESVSELIREIEGMFGEDAGGGVVLCTVHKAKGLEWDRVFVLDAEEFMPGPWARKDWEREQEVNLQYVAATRAKKELRYIKSRELRRRDDA